MSVDFKDVKEACSLLDFLEFDMGAVMHKVAGELRFNVCPWPDCGESSKDSIKVSVRDGERWHCFSCKRNGDILDAASNFFGLSLFEAADRLSNKTTDEIPRPKRVYVAPLKVERDQEAINLVISKLLEAQGQADPDVVEYLQGRAIPPDITEWAVGIQVMLTLPGDPNVGLRYLLDVVGEELLKKAGMWKKDSQCPAIIYRPLAFVSADKTGIEFKLIGESSVAIAKAIRYGNPSPCIWPGNEHAMITEGFTDMLSAVALGSERTIYAVPGAVNWEPTDTWLDELNGRHVLFGLDNDQAGYEGITRFSAELRPRGCILKRYALPEGIKDLNDQLQAISQ